MHEGEARPERSRQLPRSTPAIWLIVLGSWLMAAPRSALADPAPYFLTVAAVLVTRWVVEARRAAGLCFLGWWLVGVALALRLAEGELLVATIALAAGVALLLTARWNRPRWPELRGPGWLITFAGAVAALWFRFGANA